MTTMKMQQKQWWWAADYVALKGLEQRHRHMHIFQSMRLIQLEIMKELEIFCLPNLSDTGKMAFKKSLSVSQAKLFFEMMYKTLKKYSAHYRSFLFTRNSQFCPNSGLCSSYLIAWNNYFAPASDELGLKWRINTFTVFHVMETSSFMEVPKQSHHHMTGIQHIQKKKILQPPMNLRNYAAIKIYIIQWNKCLQPSIIDNDIGQEMSVVEAITVQKAICYKCTMQFTSQSQKYMF